MMNKKQSKRINLFKYALLAPVFSGMALLASAQEPTGTSAEKDPKAQASDIATIVFDKDTHDFGTIGESEGEVSAVFTFENRGNEPLLIREVKASCGCTIPEWTKEPVQPGGKGYVKATYGAKGRVYPFEKQITVYGYGKPANVVLRIKGTVVK